MKTGTSAWRQALHALREAGVLRDLDRYLVEAVADTHGIAPTAPVAGATALALASRAVGEGHVCLELDRAGELWQPDPAPEAGDSAPAPAPFLPAPPWPGFPGAPAQAEALFEGWAPAVGAPDEDKPFVLDGQRLYLRRMHDAERSLAERLCRRAEASEEPLLPALEERLAALLPDEGQRAAARLALTRRLAILTGGPGTGKTYTVARILPLLAEHAGALRVRLAAPTGKAALRMEESLRAADIAPPPGLDLGKACTIERLLGAHPGSPRVRHDAAHPLEADAVLVDEASMIDLPKMAKLLEALADGTRLVLLGDRRQLASVQPGSVLAELCTSRPLAGCIAQLEHSRRFPPDGAVARLSRALREVRTPEAAAAAWDAAAGAAGADPALRIHAAAGRPLDALGRVRPDLAQAILAGYRDFLDADTPEAAFAALARFRILCALRRGPWGALQINAIVETVLSQRGGADAPSAALQPKRPLQVRGEFYDHRVVMVTRNDYGAGLFNGEVGVVFPAAGRPRGEWVAVFEPTADTGAVFRRVPCLLLPEHETAFAMTVHKAQGSEFERVLVLLPDRDAPILTRELLYTAITRARRQVELWCPRQVFAQAVARQVRRSGGLCEQLDRAAADYSRTQDQPRGRPPP